MKIKNYIIWRQSFWLLLLLTLAICLTGCGERPVALADNEADANQMYVILRSEGFQVVKKPPEGESKQWKVMVDEGWFGQDADAAAITLLQDYGLPRAPEATVKDASGLGISSDRDTREKQKNDLQRQLEHQLFNLPDVIRARVVLALPDDDILSLQKTPPKAAVALTLKETQQKFTPTDVQNLVSGGVPNLKPENVTVSMSQQPLHLVPHEELNKKIRYNTIFTIGAGIIVLIGLGLAGVWYIARRRQKQSAEDLPEDEVVNERRLPELEAARSLSDDGSDE